MTAVATYSSVGRPGWSSGQGNLNQLSHEDVNTMADNRYGGWTVGNKKKPLRRENNQTNGVNGAANGWTNGKSEIGRPQGSIQSMQSLQAMQGSTNSLHQLQNQQAQQQQQQEQGHVQQQAPVTLCLAPLNGTFDKKQIKLPIAPETMRIGRQTNAKTVPQKNNGFFDSKVLSRQHAEVWADNNGRVWIRDVKSSNGTFVNGHRLSQENRESEAHELKADDVLELGIDIVGEDNRTIIHHKVAAKVEHAGMQSNNPSQYDLNVNFGDLESLSQQGVQLPNGQQLQPGLRGRSASQSSRTGPPGGNAPNYRHVNMPHAPVTLEMLVKKINKEMFEAKQQAADLQKAAGFIDALVKDNDILTGDAEKKEQIQQQQQQLHHIQLQPQPQPQVINHSLNPFRDSMKDLTSLPSPNPPPSQPLPEAPKDVPSKPESVTSKKSEKKPDPPQQMLSIVGQLATAKKELDAKASKLKDMEDLLKKERHAREQAEDRAAQLEMAALAFRPRNKEFGAIRPVDVSEKISSDEEDVDDISDFVSDTDSIASDDTAVNIPTARNTDVTQATLDSFARKVDELTASLEAARSELNAFRERALKAEKERDEGRVTIRELVDRIRKEDEKKLRTRHIGTQSHQEGRRDSESQTDEDYIKPAPKMNGFALGPSSNSDSSTSNSAEDQSRLPLSRQSTITPTSPTSSKSSSPSSPASVATSTTSIDSQLATKALVNNAPFLLTAQAGPYYSIVGVVLLGVGVMAVINSWSKGEA